MPLPKIRSRHHAKAMVFLFALTAAVTTACGDNDRDDAQNLEAPNNGGAPGDNDSNGEEGDDPSDDESDAPAGSNNDDDTPEDGAEMTDCAPDALRITQPAQGASLTPSSDEDAQAQGVQVSVTLTANVEEGTLVTLENQTTRESLGARAGSGELVFDGVTLAEGPNVLQASALINGCLARSPRLEVTLSPGDNSDNNAPEPDPEEAFRFVLIEDTTPVVSGRSPGADVDAISVMRGGDEFFAVTVEDSRVDHPDNEFNDVTELLGAPDAGCEVRNFTSLGGQRFGGYVIVSFEDAGGDDALLLSNGDSIKVYEIGAFLCGRFDDDPYRVAVSVSTELGTFIELGSGGAGGNVIPVSGLP